MHLNKKIITLFRIIAFLEGTSYLLLLFVGVPFKYLNGNDYVVKLLGKEDIINIELSERMSDAFGFRNLLVHEYAEIDYKLAYSDIDSKLSDLKQFASEVIKLIESN